MIGAVLVLGVLVSCGIVTIQWQGSRPTLQVNNEKVQEYRDETEGWLKRYRDRLANQPDEEPPIVETVQRFQSTFGGGETPTIRR